MRSLEHDRTSDAAGPTATEPLQFIRDLTRQRRHAEALAAALSLAGEAPAKRDALYLAAANLRCLNRIPEALDALKRLEATHPNFSLLHQERGYCQLTVRNLNGAIDAFQRAVAINPALIASWSALENLHRIAGDAQKSSAAAAQLAALGQLPPEIVRAGSAFSDGDLDGAEAALRAYIKSDPHVEALRLLGRIDHQRGALRSAELTLASVLERAPDYRAARIDYARVLLARQKYLEARDAVAPLLQHPVVEYMDLHSLHATACAGLGEHESAAAGFRLIVQSGAAPAPVHLLLGHSLRALGRQAAAIEAYNAALTARPDFGDAYWSLANLKTYRFAESEIARMRDLAASPTIQLIDRIHVHFALGKAFEDRASFSESWTHYERGNALKRSEIACPPELMKIEALGQIAQFTPRFFDARVGAGVPDPSPIFIVGLPRSGSTLLEQILASHSRIEGTQELSVLPRLVQDLEGRLIGELTPRELRDLGRRYLREAGVFRRSDPRRPLFIDKNPGNFRHIGLIHLMLPNAKIIDVRREPMACCFSNYTQLYAAGQEFSYDLESAGRGYRAYLALMRHWDTVLPGRVYRVIYEDLIENLEGVVRRTLAFCGLDFEQPCLDFHHTSRSVNTASSEQVRRPLNRRGLDAWTPYKPWLRALEQALGDAQATYRK